MPFSGLTTKAITPTDTPPPAKQEKRTAEARDSQQGKDAEVEGGDPSAVDGAQGEEAGEEASSRRPRRKAARATKQV